MAEGSRIMLSTEVMLMETLPFLLMGWANPVDGLGKVSTTGTSICFLFHFRVALLISMLFPLPPQCLVYPLPDRNGKYWWLVCAACSDLPARTSELRIGLSVSKLLGG